MAETKDAAHLREVLAAMKSLAAEYYQLTGKPLGVTGEVAEFVAADEPTSAGLRRARPSGSQSAWG
jgi:hypothetical protein